MRVVVHVMGQQAVESPGNQACKRNMGGTPNAAKREGTLLEAGRDSRFVVEPFF